MEKAPKKRSSSAAKPLPLVELARRGNIALNLHIMEPDFVFQLKICLDTLDVLFGGMQGSAQAFIKQALATAFSTIRTQLLNAESPLANVIPPANELTIESVCTPNGERAGVWFGKSHSTRFTLERTDVAPGTAFAFALSASTIETFVDAYWEWLTSADGKIDGTEPSANGLDQLDLARPPLETPSPQKVRITLKGVHRESGVEVPFTLTNTEVMRIEQSGDEYLVTAAEENQLLTLDFSKLDQVKDMMIAAAILVAGPFGIPSAVAAANGIEAKKEAAKKRHFDILIARRLVSFLPQKLLLKGSDKKVIFPYDKVEISLGDNGKGLVASGTQDLTAVPRKPIVKLSSSNMVVNRFDDNRMAVELSCTAVTDDMTTPFSSVKWTVDGKALADSYVLAGKLGAKPVVDLHGATIGAKLKRKFGVTITDADGLSASATVQVVISIVYFKPPEKPKKLRDKEEP